MLDICNVITKRLTNPGLLFLPWIRCHLSLCAEASGVAWLRAKGPCFQSCLVGNMAFGWQRIFKLSKKKPCSQSSNKLIAHLLSSWHLIFIKHFSRKNENCMCSKTVFFLQSNHVVMSSKPEKRNSFEASPPRLRESSSESLVSPSRYWLCSSTSF